MSNSTTAKRTYEEHQQRHVQLHRMADELVADWIWETGVLPSEASVADLLKWSHEQTIAPADRDGRFLPQLPGQS